MSNIYIEKCEDGNTIQYDGCYNCKYQCQPQCTKCIKGQCFECTTAGFYIDPTVSPWQCKEKCGDFLIVGNEQCDDGNTSDTDGCKDCKYFCRSDCASCDYTTKNAQVVNCLGLFLTLTIVKIYMEMVQSQQILMDSIQSNVMMVIQLIMMAAAALVPFQCQPTSICTSCINNRCEICATGYYLSNEKVCIPICGDSLIVIGEQCENSYILPYKGCQNGQAKCQILVSYVILLGLVVQNVNQVIIELIIYVIQIVVIKQQLKMNNAMMATQFMEMDVISVNLVARIHVLLVQKESVMIVKKVINQYLLMKFAVQLIIR
ncbi:unnamed protein product (macronuclear) [Paramecium tetraurelia]|uniref:TNFR-Cys domain-containing protein n=1 Tax=Paramecium tetraurelia TaxID=5888 RepID=A0DUH2_PARTE|nr:uncharacterized protein GSPATT00020361001 [Paramecium tetraurelia]CAK86689.1 unnamed protein product [Paramecium tetraurelia]|eukprot:XP_001454086.1 hypothetical protein (macronuclear) [Paramecium tetraurelia strain d4-2]